MTVGNDTSHLYDGKTVRSGAPSRKRLLEKLLPLQRFQRMQFQR